MSEKPTVEEYMTREVATVSPDDTVGDVARRVVDSDGHDGFPVSDGRQVEGFVSATDLLLEDEAARMFAVMSEDIVVAHPDMAVTEAARVILRSGIQKLPVVDDAGNLVGIISNADVVRSQIERATPEKARKLLRTLERIHDVPIEQERGTVDISRLTPTQSRVYADELEGRKYELERGLAEPLVVIDNAGDLLLADGHHRVLAADRLDIAEMDAYLVVIEAAVDLGMARTAEREGLEGIHDIEVVDYAHHPLIETTHRLRSEE